jgi:hypothetical protein
MPPLPFAPRPLAGEGLSSWVARLAAHNFVTPADLWADLGSDDVVDLALDDGLLERLSTRTRLDAHELRSCFAPGLAAAAPLALSQPWAIRGGPVRPPAATRLTPMAITSSRPRARPYGASAVRSTGSAWLGSMATRSSCRRAGRGSSAKEQASCSAPPH